MAPVGITSPNEVETPAPATHFKESPEIWLLYVKGEIHFCGDCATGCLKDELCSSRAAVAMGYSSEELVNKHFGHLNIVSTKPLAFEEARRVLRQDGCERFPGRSIHLYFTYDSSEGTTFLIYDPNLPQ